MMIRAVRNFVFHAYGIDRVKGLAMVEGHQQILRVLQGSPQKKHTPIIWNFKTGDPIRANMVKVINDQYVIIEQRGFIGSRATLISLQEVACMMVAPDHIF